MSALYALIDSDEKHCRQCLEKYVLSLFECHVKHSKTTLLCLLLPQRAKRDMINSSDNHLFFHYPLLLSRVNRRARPRLVAINQGYRYLGG